MVSPDKPQASIYDTDDTRRNGNGVAFENPFDIKNWPPAIDTVPLGGPLEPPSFNYTAGFGHVAPVSKIITPEELQLDFSNTDPAWTRRLKHLVKDNPVPERLANRTLSRGEITEARKTLLTLCKPEEVAKTVQRLVNEVINAQQKSPSAREKGKQWIADILAAELRLIGDEIAKLKWGDFYLPSKAKRRIELCRRLKEMNKRVEEGKIEEVMRMWKVRKLLMPELRRKGLGLFQRFAIEMQDGRDSRAEMPREDLQRLGLQHPLRAAVNYVETDRRIIIENVGIARRFFHQPRQMQHVHRMAGLSGYLSVLYRPDYVSSVEYQYGREVRAYEERRFLALKFDVVEKILSTYDPSHPALKEVRERRIS